MTDSPARRLKSIQAMNPLPVKIMRTYHFKDASIAEALMHIEFSRHRMHGEWFDVDYESLHRDAMNMQCKGHKWIFKKTMQYLTTREAFLKDVPYGVRRSLKRLCKQWKTLTEDQYHAKLEKEIAKREQ